jgi:glucans biosynthesis protein
MKLFRLLLPSLLLAALAPSARADETFDFEVLRYQAKMLASKPYAQHPVDVPESLLKLTYDQYRDIRFRPEEALWRRERLPFELQFFMTTA